MAKKKKNLQQTSTGAETVAQNKKDTAQNKNVPTQKQNAGKKSNQKPSNRVYKKLTPEEWNERRDQEVVKFEQEKDRVIDRIKNIPTKDIHPFKGSFEQDLLAQISQLSSLSNSNAEDRAFVARNKAALLTIEGAVTSDSGTFFLRYELEGIGKLAEKVKDLNNMLQSRYSNSFKKNNNREIGFSEQMTQDLLFSKKMQDDIETSLIKQIDDMLKKCYIAGYGNKDIAKAQKVKYLQEIRPKVEQFATENKSLKEVAEELEVRENEIAQIYINAQRTHYNTFKDVIMEDKAKNKKFNLEEVASKYKLDPDQLKQSIDVWEKQKEREAQKAAKALEREQATTEAKNTETAAQ